MAHQLAQAEVYVPWSLQVWRAVMNWLTFFYQICLQIVSFTPSIAQILSYVGLRQSLLFCSSLSFKPLPVVELPLTESSTAAPLHVSVNDIRNGGGYQCLEKLTVVLDLDETLVCAYETSSLPAVVHAQAIEAGLKWFELECVSSDKECEGKPKISYVTVFERPGLHEFLKQIGEFADLILFTAGLEDYARPLVDKIDVDDRFCHRLYRPSTVSTSK